MANVRTGQPPETTPEVNFIDCSLRDGHQSLLATRMSTQQCLRVLPLLKDSGYGILELWGGATLDAALRFTGDDPFDRLDRFYKVLGKDGPAIRSLCRGQNLFGYTPYADNVVVEFLKEAVRSGNRRVRIFDALNDPRNLMTAIMAVKTFDGHAEAALSYTTSPVHNTAHFVNFAKKALDQGADSLAVKDMAGLLTPWDAFELFTALKKECPGVEISLHSHCTNGLAVTTYVVGMVCGISNYDTCYGPMAGGTSQPPVELLSFFAQELGLSTNVNMKPAAKIDGELRQIRKELAKVDAHGDKFGNPWPAEPPAAMRKLIQAAINLIQKRGKKALQDAIGIIEDQILVPQGYPAVDRKQLDAQVPGGMLSNLHNQLKEQGKLDLLPRILEEVPKVRAAAGYVPLVTPTSQIVGTQAAFNVMTGSPYSMMTKEFKALIAGRYGRLPGPADARVVEQVVAAGEELCTRRPADYVADVDLEKVYGENGALIKTHRDLLLVLLFPLPAKQFLEKRGQKAAA